VIQDGHHLDGKGNTQKVNIIRKEEIDSAKLENLMEAGMPAKERIRMGSNGFWSKPRMRCNGTRSG
jgi:hypothetical protein